MAMINAQPSSTSVYTNNERILRDDDSFKATDHFEAKPYFANGVYAKARAARDRAAAANQARIDNPIATAKAIRDVYEGHELVALIKDAFVQLGKERQHPVVYWFDDLPLVLTERGFRDVDGKVIGDKLALPSHMSAATACQKIDLALVSLAEAPEKYVAAEPRRVFLNGNQKFPARCASSSSSVSGPREAAYKNAPNRPTVWYEHGESPKTPERADFKQLPKHKKPSLGLRFISFLKTGKRSRRR